MDLDKFLAKARETGKLGKLNLILGLGIPFNKPHGIKLQELTEDKVSAVFPYKRKNLNHIKGLHACGLATVAEFCSGIALLNKLGTKKYRLIMSTLRMEYHYQAKATAIASYTMSAEKLQEMILGPLEKEDAVLLECEVPVHDTAGNHLCTAYVNWQVKPWDKVRTKR